MRCVVCVFASFFAAVIVARRRREPTGSFQLWWLGAFVGSRAERHLASEKHQHPHTSHFGRRLLTLNSSGFSPKWVESIWVWALADAFEPCFWPGIMQRCRRRRSGTEHGPAIAQTCQPPPSVSGRRRRHRKCHGLLVVPCSIPDPLSPSPALQKRAMKKR